LFPQPSIIALHLLQDVISVEFEQETNWRFFIHLDVV
jgi:hypothetical protein